VVAIDAVVVYVELVENAIGRGSHFHGQIHCNVLETQITRNVDWSSATLISLTDELEDLTLTEGILFVVLEEDGGYISNFSSVN